MVRTYKKVEYDRRAMLVDKAGPYKEPTRPLDPIVYALRKRRYDIGISIPALAKRMNVDHTTVAAWECGSRNPGRIALYDWCRALDMELTVTPKETDT